MAHRKYHRVTLYRAIRQIVDRFERDDYALAHMIELAQADGYGSGGDGGGGRSSGDHSDPVLSTCTQRDDPNDPATKAFDQLVTAFEELAKADNARRHALPPRPDEEPPASQTAATPKPVDDPWCTSCAQVRRGKEQLVFVEADRNRGRRDLCPWCQARYDNSGPMGKRRVPDPRLIMLREYCRRVGSHMTAEREREALALGVTDARAKYLGIHEKAKTA